MKPVIYIRVAAVLTFIHAVLHTVGGVFGSIGPGPASIAVAAMKANPFLFMGSPRTFWDFHMGLGLGISISLSMESIVMWYLAPLGRSHVAQVRPILLAFAVGYLALAVNSYVYFFLAPVIVECLIALCLVLAAITLKKLASGPEREMRQTGRS